MRIACFLFSGVAWAILGCAGPRQTVDPTASIVRARIVHPDGKPGGGLLVTLYRKARLMEPTGPLVTRVTDADGRVSFPFSSYRHRIFYPEPLPRNRLSLVIWPGADGRVRRIETHPESAGALVKRVKSGMQEAQVVLPAGFIPASRNDPVYGRLLEFNPEVVMARRVGL